MARYIEQGKSIYIPFKYGVSITDSQLHLRMYKTKEQYERHFPGIREGVELLEYAPVVHGRWVAVPSSDMMTGKAYKCSECGKMRYGSFMPNYCQCCGAKMDLEVE